MRVEKFPRIWARLKLSKDESLDPFDYVDLRDQHQPCRVPPGELVLIGTNEYIALPENMGALVVSKVRQTSKGWSHVSTQVEPNWEGILQISQTNYSPFSKTIRGLGSICSVKFYRISRTPDEKVLRDFERSKSHFGVSWENYEKGVSNLFPIENSEEYLTQLYNEVVDDINVNARSVITSESSKARESVILWGANIVLAIFLGIGATLVWSLHQTNISQELRIQDLKQSIRKMEDSASYGRDSDSQAQQQGGGDDDQ